MLFYLYALADALADVSGLTGLESAPLALLPVGEVTVVGAWLTQTPAVERANLITQDRVVRELHTRAAALLPMRFGTGKDDLDAAARAVEALGSLRTRMNLVRGRDQMTIRVLAALAPAAPVAPATLAAPAASAAPAMDTGAGRRYLASRAAKAIPRELVPILDALGRLQRATRVEASRQAGLIGTVYQLVDRAAGDEYRRVAEDAAAKFPNLTVRISGPSPAYAFASETP